MEKSILRFEPQIIAHQGTAVTALTCTKTVGLFRSILQEPRHVTNSRLSLFSGHPHCNKPSPESNRDLMVCACTTEEEDASKKHNMYCLQ